MRLKKLGAALAVVAALGAVLASSALATAVTQDSKFYIGSGSGTELTGSESITAEQVGTATLSTAISGTAVELQWTGTECVECKIENSKGAAAGSGKLKLTGVSVVKPLSCGVPVTVVIEPRHIAYDWMKLNGQNIENPSTQEWEPGEEHPWATLELTGAKCPLNERSIVPKGSLFTANLENTGTQTVTQQIAGSKSINEGGGGTFHVGTEPAVLTETMNLKLSGANAGSPWGTH